MNYFLLNIISSLSILLPATMIAVRLKGIASCFYPFAIMLWVGAFNECLSLSLLLHHRPNMPNSNIYVLVEYFLLVWQFKLWNHWNNLITAFFCILGIGVWFADNLLLHTLRDDNSLFRMCYSAVIVFLAMMQLSRFIIKDSINLLRNAQFLLCLTFVVYYAFKTYYESFNLFNAGISDKFFDWLWLVLNFINFISNLSYAYAIIWMKKKIPLELPL